MKRMNQSRSRRWAAVVLGAAMLGGVSAAWGEVVYVTDSANVLSDEGPASTTVANAPSGTALTVIARDGNWINVQLTISDGSTVSGWVLSTAVQSSKPGGDALSGLFGGGNAQASDVSASAASKGLGDQAADYARTNNMSPANELKMEHDRGLASFADWKAFCTLADGATLGKIPGGGKAGK
jgi:uncharacterized protein YgiM (DUF1202 family)